MTMRQPRNRRSIIVRWMREVDAILIVHSVLPAHGLMVHCTSSYCRASNLGSRTYKLRTQHTIRSWGEYGPLQ